MSEEPISYREVKCQCLSPKVKTILEEGVSHRLGEVQAEKRKVQEAFSSGAATPPQYPLDQILKVYDDRIGHYNTVLTILRDIPSCPEE